MFVGLLSKTFEVTGSLANLKNIIILGTMINNDGVEFILIKSNVGIVAIDLSSGFLYPAKHIYELASEDLRSGRFGHDEFDCLSNGTDIGELVKCGFLLDREGGEKRLRTVLEIPTNWKVQILSGGGFRVKNDKGERMPVFSLLKVQPLMEYQDEKIAEVAKLFTPEGHVLGYEDEYYLSLSSKDRIIEADVRKICYDFILAENKLSPLKTTILLCASSEDEGLVSDLRGKFQCIITEDKRRQTKTIGIER